MRAVAHTIMTDNEPGALADDLRSYAALIDFCAEAGIETVLSGQANTLSVTTSQLSEPTARKLEEVMASRYLLFAESAPQEATPERP